VKTKILRKQDLQPSIGVVVGTRPGIIKFSPVIRELANRGADFFIIHTGQHYSYNMDRTFFEELELPEPRFSNDQVRHFATHGGQTAEMIKGVEQACIEAKPSVVIVGGDANTNLAGALAVRKLVCITLVHMEAGLRSHDWQMPEEHNRVMIDHISDVLLAPTAQAIKNLETEKIKGRIYYTGNTIVDAVQQNLSLAQKKSRILGKIGQPPYVLLTVHREENVDHRERLGSILTVSREVKQRFEMDTIFPCHPRTQRRISQFGLAGLVEDNPGLKIMDAVGYLDFLMLVANARIVLTDSGGIQEESCILKVPCVTLRDKTERPETLEAGSNIIVGTDPAKIVAGMAKMLEAGRQWANPFGDGQAARRIVDILVDCL
jgi:UDP-N-acetylglucosamine 2-epimerase (non-hydrolysing)